MMALLLVLALVGCEDLPPNQYDPQYVVQGILLVGDPIGGITVARSQSVVDTFHLANSAITDATIQIEVDGRTLPLAYRADSGLGEYYFPDTTELIRANTLYKLRVSLTDGTVLTAQTLTPSVLELTQAPSDSVRFPQDTINQPTSDSLYISWKAVDGMQQYLVSAEALDTLEYGVYLVPPTTELNSRTPRGFGRGNGGGSPDRIRWGVAPITAFDIPWRSFRWFGKHELALYAPDSHFLDWFKITKLQQQPQYDPLRGSITGGVGVFGSASVIRRSIFILKNRP